MGLKRGETFVAVSVLWKDGPKKGETFVAVSVLSKDGPKKGGNFCGSKRFRDEKYCVETFASAPVYLINVIVFSLIRALDTTALWMLASTNSGSFNASGIQNIRRFFWYFCWIFNISAKQFFGHLIFSKKNTLYWRKCQKAWNGS